MTNTGKQIAVVVAVIVGLALLSPFASSFPDGLEKTAEVTGFSAKASTLAHSIFADYTFPGIHSAAVNSILAGLVGAALVFGLVWLLAKLLMKMNRGK